MEPSRNHGTKQGTTKNHQKNQVIVTSGTMRHHQKNHIGTTKTPKRTTGTKVICTRNHDTKAERTKSQ